MPLKRRTGSKQETEENFHEFRHGKTFQRTAARYGKETAQKQMIAAVLSNKRKAATKKHKTKKRVAGKR